MAAIVNSLWKDFLAWRAIPEQYLNQTCDQNLPEVLHVLTAKNGGVGSRVSLLLDLAGGQEKLQSVGVGELLLQRLKVFFADVLSKQVNRLKAGTKQSAK